PLEHDQPDPPVEVAEPLAERSATGDGVPTAAAERSTQAAVDQAGEQRVPRAERQRHPALVESAGGGEGGVGTPVEDPAPRLGGGALRGGVEDLLEHPGYGEHERRLETPEVSGQVLDVGAVAEPDPRLDSADLDDPREDMGQREEHQRGGVLGLEELV